MQDPDLFDDDTDDPDMEMQAEESPLPGDATGEGFTGPGDADPELEEKVDEIIQGDRQSFCRSSIDRATDSEGNAGGL